MKNFISRNVRVFSAVLIGTMGLVNLVSSLYPAVASRQAFLSDLLSIEFQYGGRLTTTILGVVLVVLAPYLLKGKKAAYYSVLVITLLSTITHLIKGFDWEEALIGIGIFTFLSVNSKQFQAKSDPFNLKMLPLHASIILSILILYGISGFFILEEEFVHKFKVREAITSVLSAELAFYEPDSVQKTYHATQFVFSLYVLGAGWYAYILLIVLSPVLVRVNPTHTERMKALKIYAKFAHTPLQFFTLLGEKQYFFSDGSYVAYQTVGGIALVLGRPIGSVENMKKIIRNFELYAHTNDWTPAYYQIEDEFKAMFEECGYNTLLIGEDAYVNTQTFTLEGSVGKDFRYICKKLEKQKYYCEFYSKNMLDSGSYMSQLKKISSEWLQNKKLKEMQFSMGWFSEDVIRDEKVLVMKNSSDQPVAFITLIQMSNSNEVAIDLMRFADGLPNGTMDYLFIQAILWAQKNGAHRINLGLSPLSGSGNDTESSLVEKVLYKIYTNVTDVYNFQGLHHFKAKFNPVWEKRYLAYKKHIDLPFVGNALLTVHTK